MIHFLSCADDAELSRTIDTVNQRYHSLHPDWDIIYLALPQNDPKERERLFQKAISVFSGR